MQQHRLPTNLNVFDSVNELALAAADVVVDIARTSIEERGRFTIALSGGNTPGKLFSILAVLPYRNLIDWSRTFIFWGDERCVPLNDDQNNAFEADKVLISKVPLPRSNVHPIPVNLSPSEAAASYEQELITFFGTTEPRFDLILLGLGENGHTASLFPGTEVIHDNGVGIRAVYVADLQMFRITATAALINLAHHIVVLVTGKQKADILHQVVTSAFQSDKYPIQLINPQHGSLIWLADKDAVSVFTSRNDEL